MFSDHFDRLEYALTGSKDLSTLPEFMTNHTFIKGMPFSFRGHEFQKRVVEDVSQVVNVQKCSQIGLTETQIRWALAACARIPHFSIIYTMPFSKDAEKVSKTRVDPIVDDSPKLTSLKNSTNWNASVKSLGSSLLYFGGTNSETAAISTPADCIISDEVDRSDKETLEQYESRMTHSTWQLRRNFSTPTVGGRGIAELMLSSKRYRNLCKCTKCNTWQNPTYENNARLPGWDRPLLEITKYDLGMFDLDTALMVCVKCGAPLDLNANREYVLENPGDKFTASGIYISPFDAPKIITLQRLIWVSTQYTRKSEFINQNLGLVAEEAMDTITKEDLSKSYTYDVIEPSWNHIGCDMGMICTIVVGRVFNGELVITHRERVSISDFEPRYLYLCAKYNVINRVIDSMPYSDTVMRLQRNDHNLYGAYYNLDATHICSTPEVPRSEVTGVYPVRINKSLTFDEVLAHYKRGSVVMSYPADRDLFEAQLTDMKKVPGTNKDGETIYVWKKSDKGNDHYHHALIYMYVASSLPFAPQERALPLGVPLTSKFRMKSVQ